MGHRNPALRRRWPAVAVLPRRVHLPVQPPRRPFTRPALLPAPATGGRSRPSPAEGPDHLFELNAVDPGHSEAKVSGCGPRRTGSRWDPGRSGFGGPGVVDLI